MSTPVNNTKVVQAWINGEDARNHRETFTSSNGRLKSYDEVIGVNMGGTCIVRDATARGGQFYSQTTSCHVGMARSKANIVWHPKVWAATKEVIDFANGFKPF